MGLRRLILKMQGLSWYMQNAITFDKTLQNINRDTHSLLFV